MKQAHARHSGETANSSRVKGLDGLRAIAALLVMFFHLQYADFGWAGVEIFFVISGYLITRILINSATEEGGLGAYLGRFFWRRSLRIFPLYFTVIGIEIAWTLLHGEKLNAAQVARATYTYNWYRAFHLGSDPTALGSHFWSLASEEQFYAVWPFFVYFFYRCGWLTRATLALVIAGAVIRCAASLVFPADQTPWIVYHAGIFQIGPLALGALIACGGVPRIRRAWAWAVGFAIAAMLAGAAANGFQNSLGFTCTMWRHHQWFWGYTAIDLVSAALVIACIQEEAIVRVLELRPLRRLGRVSYGFYLFHPFLAVGAILIARHLMLGRRYFGPAAILVTWLAAELSFRYFETPFLELRDRTWFRRKPAEPRGALIERHREARALEPRIGAGLSAPEPLREAE